jgi:UTP-glucose-1-phosphate uridylyltransferase
MANLTLVVMAAGIGSRYGGLKQVDPIGPNGEIIIHYSVYDALRAGFSRVVFVIRHDIETAFREIIGDEIERRTDVAYVYQELADLPPGFNVPAERVKPWGTAHAVWCCKDVVTTPFAAINADDFYGAGAYRTLAGYMGTEQHRESRRDYCMVGYVLRNTLSEHGHVARGVCEVTAGGYLKSIRELLHIEALPDGIQYRDEQDNWAPLAADSPVSMNFWGFTPTLFDELEERLPRFLARNMENLKSEFLLPNLVGDLVREERARIKVLHTDERWFGVTYQADRPRVQAAVRDLIAQGRYPQRLWAG